MEETKAQKYHAVLYHTFSMACNMHYCYMILISMVQLGRYVLSVHSYVAQTRLHANCFLGCQPQPFFVWIKRNFLEIFSLQCVVQINNPTLTATMSQSHSPDHLKAAGTLLDVHLWISDNRSHYNLEVTQMWPSGFQGSHTPSCDEIAVLPSW